MVELAAPANNSTIPNPKPHISSPGTPGTAAGMRKYQGPRTMLAHHRARTSPSLATSRAAARAPMKPPSDGTPMISPYCQGSNPRSRR